mgnify:FL=1
MPAGPLDMVMRVRIAADGVSAERLRELVAGTCHCTPVSCTVETPLPLALEIEVQAT